MKPPTSYFSSMSLLHESTQQTRPGSLHVDHLLDSLRPDDTISLVTYAGINQTLLQNVAVAERETIMNNLKP